MTKLTRMWQWLRRGDGTAVALLGAALVIYLVRTVSGPGTPEPLFGKEVPRAALRELDGLGLGRSLGDPRAPLKIVEFVDYECPACAVAHDSIWPVAERHIREGRIHYTAYHLPLPRHAAAIPAAVVLECVGATHAPGKFWSLRTELLRRQDEWGGKKGPAYPALLRIAGGAGLDSGRIAGCVRTRGPGLERNLATGWKAAEAEELSFTPIYGIDGRVVYWREVRDQLDSIR